MRTKYGIEWGLPPEKIESNAVSGCSLSWLLGLLLLLLFFITTIFVFVLRKFPFLCNCGFDLTQAPGGTCQHEQTVLQTRAIRPFKGGGLTSDVWNPITDESQIGIGVSPTGRFRCGKGNRFDDAKENESNIFKSLARLC